MARLDPAVPIEFFCGRLVGPAASGHGGDAVSQVDRNGGRLLIDAIDDESRHVLIPGVAVQKQEATEAMMYQALRRLEVDALQRLVRQRHRPRKLHVIRRLTDHQDRRNEDVGPLRNEFRAFDARVEIRSHRRLRSVLLDRGHGDQHHVRSREQIADLLPRHVRQEVLDLLLVPQRIGLTERAWRG